MRPIAASGRASVSVWGAISPHGLGPLHRIDGSLTALQYVDILDHVMLPYALDGPFPDGAFKFQHDRSPVHKAKVVRDYLEERCITELPWPPCGADINIIENVWGIMKKRLAKKTLRDSSRDTLWAVVSEEWQRLREDRELCPALYGSIPRRINSVVSQNGACTHY